MAEFYAAADWSDMFHIPLSPEAFEELQLVLSFKPDNLNHSDAVDSWSYVWGHVYFPKKLYEHCHKDIVVPPPFAWIWKSKLHMKLKVFMWFLLIDRLNTRNMLRRRHFNVNEGFNYVLRSAGVEETIEHLIFTCPFSSSCWQKVGIVWNLNLSRIEAIQAARRSFNGELFFEFVGIVAWNIWKERNNFIFRHIPPSLAAWRERSKADLLWLKFRVDKAHWDYITLFALAL